MTLFIACLIIYCHDLPWWLNLLAGAIWMVHIGFYNKTEAK